eukprot:SAG11_NODE_620_length_8171_cov_9.337339_9_plen_195_part_00
MIGRPSTAPQAARPSPAPCHQVPYQRDVPDAPAMAWRDPATNLTYLVSGNSRGTWPSIGPSLDEVKHSCGEMIFNYSGTSGFLEPARDFSSHEWLYAPYVRMGRRGLRPDGPERTECDALSAMNFTAGNTQGCAMRRAWWAGVVGTTRWACLSATMVASTSITLHLHRSISWQPRPMSTFPTTVLSECSRRRKS